MCYVVNVKTIISVVVGIVGAATSHLAFAVKTNSHTHWQNIGTTGICVGKWLLSVI